MNGIDFASMVSNSNGKHSFPNTPYNSHSSMSRVSNSHILKDESDKSSKSTSNKESQFLDYSSFNEEAAKQFTVSESISPIDDKSNLTMDQLPNGKVVI